MIGELARIRRVMWRRRQMGGIANHYHVNAVQSESVAVIYSRQ